MGAKQSKRSVDISGTPKKGDQENGAVVAEEKLEKISEGDTLVAKVNANGSTTTTSTLTAEQQEAAAAATETPSTPTKTETVETTEKTEEEAAPTTPSEEKEDPSSPVSPSAETTEEGSSEKKKKSKKKWSFRSWSFSKKDRVKPNTKEEKQETVPEDNEAAAQSEQVNPEVTNVSCVQNEEPPPLPTSPPPTPAEETPETPLEKEETPTISEGDVDASGGGEGLAEPIEDAELEAAAPVPVAEKIAEAIKEVETKLTAVAAPIVEKVADTVEDAVAAVAELKLSSTPPPVPTVNKHVEQQDEDSVLKVTSQIESAIKQPLTNGVGIIEVNGNAELNGDAELNGKPEL